jgi:hypothetical protein
MSNPRFERPKIKGIKDIPGIRPARKPVGGAAGGVGVPDYRVMRRPSPPMEFDGPIPALIWLLRWASQEQPQEPSAAMKRALQPHLAHAYRGGRTLETWMYALAEEMGESDSMAAAAMNNLLAGAWALLLTGND